MDQEPVVVVDRSEKVYHVDWSPDGRYLAFSNVALHRCGFRAVGTGRGWNL